MTGQRGRPVNEERQLALITGETSYEGKRCRECGSTERYTKSGSCVVCTKRAAGKVRRTNRAKLRRRQRDAELAALLGTEVETQTFEDVVSGEDADNASESTNNTEENAKSAFSVPSYVHPSIIDYTHLSVHNKIGDENRESGVLEEDSAAEVMASPDTTHRIVRYFCHSESGCVWTTTDAEVPGDGSEEISAETYADLVKAGFTISAGDDDLSDILG